METGDCPYRGKVKIAYKYTTRDDFHLDQLIEFEKRGIVKLDVNWLYKKLDNDMDMYIAKSNTCYKMALIDTRKWNVLKFGLYSEPDPVIWDSPEEPWYKWLIMDKEEGETYKQAQIKMCSKLKDLGIDLAEQPKYKYAGGPVFSLHDSSSTPVEGLAPFNTTVSLKCFELVLLDIDNWKVVKYGLFSEPDPVDWNYTGGNNKWLVIGMKEGTTYEEAERKMKRSIAGRMY
jgi:hypothetical protein